MISRRSLMIAGVGLAAASAREVLAQSSVDESGSEPTEAEIEERLALYKKMSPKRTKSRQDVVDELREAKRTLQEARRRGIEIGDAEVDEAIAGMARRMRMDPGQIKSALAQTGVEWNSFRERLRDDLARAAVRARP